MNWKKTRSIGKELRKKKSQGILNLYSKGESCPTIASAYGTTQATINRIIKENGGKLRTISDSVMGIAKGRKRSIENNKRIVESRKKNGWFKNPERTKEKISKSHKGKHYSPKTEWKKRHKMVRTKKHNRKIGLANLRRKEKFGYINSPETRRKMRVARAKVKYPKVDTSIEVKIQNFLKELGIEFFTHQYMKIDLAYQCDIFIPSMNLIIEADGDYWHGNLDKYGSWLNLNKQQRIQKIRDFERTAQLEGKGYTVIRLWEHEIRSMRTKQFKKILYQNLNKEERVNNFMELLKDLEVKIG
ncbi:MAG: very short patch repair endonuclease [Nanoarchaeota archaeon]|nr:very short patch repair endonuclease [Nanoarchaeota archaeon]